MPIIELAELQALAANYTTKSVTFSAESQALFYCLFQYADALYNWQGASSPLTTSEIDDIKALVALAYVELMEAFTLNTKTILAPIVLYEQTLAGSDVFFIDLSALDDYADCESIEIYLHLRAGQTGAAAGFVICYLNSDGTDSHYDNSRVVNFTSLAGQNNAGKAYIGACPGASATANIFSDLRVWIYRPHSGHLKNVVSQAATPQNTTNTQTEINTMTWNDTSAITSLTFVSGFTPSIDFVAGSSIRIIGYKELTVYTP